jgi:adenosylcobyric acid synthase
MGFARAAGVPVLLVGDIDRGGVIAALVGTHAVIDAADSVMIVGFAINKFRGDLALFDDGLVAIERATGWRSFGVIPWLAAAARLPAEDAVALDRPAASRTAGLRIVAPMMSRLANFDDADPLRMEPGVDFAFIPPGKPIPRDADAVILFGTKATIEDLRFLRTQGWDHDILAHARTGGRVLGICGGFQMLGRTVRDPLGIEGPAGDASGLGLLAMDTQMLADKHVRVVAGRCARTDAPVRGYEIHSGRTTGDALARPMLMLDDGPDGAVDGLVEGTYVHGLFADDTFRRSWLQRLGVPTSPLAYDGAVDAALDELADGIEAALDVDAVIAAARAPGWIGG